MSHKTAIKRNKPSAPMAELMTALGIATTGKKMLDYGCGHGFDADFYGLDKFDPHFFPEETKKNHYDIVFCNYVLNVIPTNPDRAMVIASVMECLKVGGEAYFTVRNDKQNLNGLTSRGTYQVLVQLPFEVFIKKSGRYVIYRYRKDW